MTDLDALADLVAERVAARLVHLLTDPATTAVTLVDAATLATTLGVSRAWVYDHADELGAIRLGDGDRPRLRFNVDRARTAHDQPCAPSAGRATVYPAPGSVLRPREAA